jgi:uncharacterized protein (TIGR02679 family)
VTADLALIADDEELAPLWAALHERLCTGQAAQSISRVRVEGLSSAGVATLRSLLDTSTRRRRDRSAVTVSPLGASVPVRELLKVLGIESDALRIVVERATGSPVTNRAEIRRAAAEVREELWADANTSLPNLPGLVARMRTAGVGDNDLAVRRLIGALTAALRRIPATPPVSLAKLAHDCAGDPHYFDLDTQAGSRLVTALAELRAKPEPTRPDLVRALLLEVGVIADRLSATVLLHHVRVTGDGPIDRRLRDSDTPVALTLLDLTQNPPTLAREVLTVIENPSVLEAAMAINDRRALACTSGHLGSVDHALLQLAVDQGVPLRYAGDLDERGIMIAESVARTYGAQLIAMDAATVLAAQARPSAVPLSPLPKSGVRQLDEALHQHGYVIFQESDEALGQLFGK